jgi:HK97 family phage prohead protease
MFDKEITAKGVLKTEGDDAGTIEAVISTFDVVDRDGDIVLASAFEDGEAIPMVWSHDWQMPIGKGVINVKDNRAVFKGRLNLNTDWGRNAYESIKDMGDLQEYSWGFQILDSDIVDRDGEKRRAIKTTERFEASPVLVGAAGRGRTQTLSIKGATLAAQSEAVLAAAEVLADRLKSLADIRAKEGRTLSTANRDRLKVHRESLRTIADDLDALLVATEPGDDGKGAKMLALLIETELIEARLNGVAA